MMTISTVSHQSTRTFLCRAERFLLELGIFVSQGEVRDSFLAGCSILPNARIVVNPNHPHAISNLLHEAGHLAVVPSVFRNEVFGDIDTSLERICDSYFSLHPDAFNYPEDPIGRGLLQAGEMEAQAWSYAAAVHAEIPPVLVFNDSVQEGFSDVLAGLLVGSHLGIHGLQASGMASKRTFPCLIKWVQA